MLFMVDWQANLKEIQSINDMMKDGILLFNRQNLLILASVKKFAAVYSEGDYKFGISKD